MAQLRGDTTVGGKPIVTLDEMNEFVQQIQGSGLSSKMNKLEATELTSIDQINEVGTNKDNNGIWSVSAMDLLTMNGMIPYGILSNYNTDSSNFQLYSTQDINKKESLLYFRTGSYGSFNAWKKVATTEDILKAIECKFDKTGGDISGNVIISGGLNCDGFVSRGVINWFERGLQLGLDRNFILGGGSNLTFFSDDKEMEMLDDTIRYNNNRVWHDGNLNPNDYVSKSAELLTQGTNLDTVLTTGFYRCYLATSVPANINNWSYIEVIRHDDNYVLQKIYSFDGNYVYSRTKYNGVWGEWKSLVGLSVYSSAITSTNWTKGTDMYELTITHNLKSTNISSVIVTDSNNMSMFTGFQVISSTVIKIFSATNPSGKVVINAVQ